MTSLIHGTGWWAPTRPLCLLSTASLTLSGSGLLWSSGSFRRAANAGTVACNDLAGRSEHGPPHLRPRRAGGTARRARNRSIACAADPAAQAPLGLTVGNPVVCSSRCDRARYRRALTPYGVIFLTRHASRCRPGQTAPRLPSRAPAASGMLFMGLGNLTPTCDASVFGKNTCVDIQGFAWTTSGLQPGLNRHGPRSFPKDAAVFPGCAWRTGA